MTDLCAPMACTRRRTTTFTLQAPPRLLLLFAYVALRVVACSKGTSIPPPPCDASSRRQPTREVSRCNNHLSLKHVTYQGQRPPSLPLSIPPTRGAMPCPSSRHGSTLPHFGPLGPRAPPSVIIIPISSYEQEVMKKSLFREVLRTCRAWLLPAAMHRPPGSFVAHASGILAGS